MIQEGCGPDHVIRMLHGHKDRVNCVRWMSWRSGHAQSQYVKAIPLELVSGSVDNDVIVWKQSIDSSEVCKRKVLIRSFRKSLVAVNNKRAV